MKCLSPSYKKTVVNGAGHTYRHPCGKCNHCRRNKQSQWKARLLLESLDHEWTSFVTFTYNDLHCPPTTRKQDAQRLIKRLRKLWHAKTGRTLRYYLVAEIGSRTGRPHYHAIIFGVPFTEQSIFEDAWRKNIGSPRKPKYASLGFIQSREFTEARAGYVVKYATKFLRTPFSNDADSSPEFALMSRGTDKRTNRGIGLNGLSRVIASIKTGLKNSKLDLYPSQYWDIHCNGLKIGRSRCSISPYIKSEIFKFLSNEEYQCEENRLRKLGYSQTRIDQGLIKYERVKELKRARMRTRNIPLDMDKIYDEIVERNRADKVAKRKIRETKRKIKI